MRVSSSSLLGKSKMGIAEHLSNRDLGDQARDRKAWREAAELYQLHLRLRPDDWPIWVQLGHARKEGGDLIGAEAAYRTAMAQAPGDADVRLHLGHLMKVTGRTNEAIDLFERSFELEPGLRTYAELVELGEPTRADRVVRTIVPGAAGPTMYLQIGDLLNFLRTHSTPSGIQRVQLGVIQHYLVENRHPGELRLEFVFNRSNDVQVWKVFNAKLRLMIDYLASENVDCVTLRQIIDDMVWDGILVRPGPSDCFIVLGAFWGVAGNTALMANLRCQGASVGLYIYDLIPITFPEYCNHQLSLDFTRDLCEALHLADFALAISEYSAQELRQFIEKHGFRAIPVEAVPLAHSLTGTQSVSIPEGGLGQPWSEAIAALQGREFVLCVCTIEARKNHRYLYDAWKMLKHEGVTVPELVFVGRRGWHMDDFFAQLDSSNGLDGSIKVLHDLSDTELATLYRACRFTVFPSIVEGWGLPVGESLSFGKLCVSSNSSSMSEVGGDLVAYVDPLNLRAGIEVLRDLITRPEKVTEWEQRIRADFKPRSWDDASRQLLTIAHRLHRATRDSRVRPPAARLRPGEILQIANLARTAKLLPLHKYGDLQRLALNDSWYPPEAFGAWMKGTVGQIVFDSGLTSGQWAVAYIRFIAAPNFRRGVVTISAAVGEASHLCLVTNQAATIPLKATAGEDGIIEITITVQGQYDATAQLPRVFCIGISSIAFADEQDVVARTELLERLLLN